MVLRITAVAIALLAFFLLTTAAAAPPQSFTVSPVKLELRAEPGETRTAEVKVANQGAAPIRITTSIVDYTILPDNTFVFHEPGELSYSSARWITLDKMEFSLEPGAMETVTISLAVPTNAEPGGHYACVFFQNGAEKPDGTGVSITGRVGTLVLTAVGSETAIVRAGEIRRFTADNPRFGRDVTFNLAFYNSGNVHLTLKGTVTLTDIFGRAIGEAPLESITILPATERQITASWNGPWWGRFTARPTVKYGPNMFTYDVAKTAPEVTFWIIPWPFIPPALVMMALLLVAVKARRSRKKRLTRVLPDHPFWR